MSDEQKAECERLIESFKKNLTKAADEAISNLYVDILPHIESDTFLNFKNDAMSAIKGYATRYVLDTGDYTGLAIRNQIYQEHKEEIAKLIDQDPVDGAHASRCHRSAVVTMVGPQESRESARPLRGRPPSREHRGEKFEAGQATATFSTGRLKHKIAGQAVYMLRPTPAISRAFQSCGGWI